MAKKKYKNTLLHSARLFNNGGGATNVASSYSSLGNKYREQGLFPEGTNDLTVKETPANSIDGGQGTGTNNGGGGNFMSNASQVAGLAGMFDSIAQSATASIDASRSETTGQPQVLVEGVLGGQSGSHLGNMWNTSAKTREAINYVNNLDIPQYAINNSDNLLAQYSDKRMDNLNIDTTGKEWEDAIFDPASWLLTKGFGLRESADKRQKRINDAINAVNARQRAAYDSAVDDFRKNQTRNVLANYRAFGGPMYGYMSDGAIAYDMARDNLMIKAMNAQGKSGSQPANTFAAGGLLSDNFTNGVTTIGVGGSHEKNPYSGVPMGLAEDGQPNLVEEGEAIYNDYVFSNRLKVPKAIRNKYKLRGPKEMTFAEAFINAQKESRERENDPISKNGLDNIAMILAQTQEEVKAKKESRKKAQGGHLFAIGSSLDNPPFDESSMTPEEFYRINSYWPEGYDPATGQWVTIGEPSNWTPEKLMSISGEPAPAKAAPAVVPAPAVAPGGVLTKEESKDKKSSNTSSGSAGGINPLRLAPILANGMAVLTDTFGATNKVTPLNYIPAYREIGFSPLGDFAPEAHFDTRYQDNQLAAQAAATRNAMLNTTAANRWANVLGADYLSQIARGQALREADIAAYDNLLKTMTFNRGTRQYNSDKGADVAARNNEQRLANAQARLNQARAEIDETNAAWGARGQNIGNFAESIGYLGRELDARRDRDILLPSLGRGMTLEQIKGWVSPSKQREYALNQGFTEEEIKAAGISAYGGKIKRKKRGLTY